MNEKPQSFWKKSRPLPGSFLGWLVLMAGLALAISFLGALIIDGAQWQRDWGIVWVVTGVATAVAFLFLFIRGLCCWRNFKRFSFGLVCFITLIALFYAEENWRGKHAWEKYKRAGEARGEKFDFTEFVPAPVPGDQNFALTPVVFTCYGEVLTRDGREIPSAKRDENFANRMAMDIAQDQNAPKPNGLGDWATGKTSDLKIWQNYYRALAATTNEFPVAAQPQSPAADVLLALSKYSSTIEDLRQASQLPDSRFPLEYDKADPSEILLPHLSALKRCSQVLQLRALAELQNGQRAQAFADTILTLRLADSIRTEPFIISQLVRITIFRTALQPIWEGLAEHQWSNAQLDAFDTELVKLDFPADYLFSVRSERAFHIKLIHYLEQNRSRSSEFFGIISDVNHPDNTENFWLNVGVWFMPKGWFYQNDIALSQLQQDNLMIWDMARLVVSPKKITEAYRATESSLLHMTPCNFFARVLAPALGAFGRRAAYGQNGANLARVAIALERHRLAHGEFPESLDSLTPKFIAKIPHDIINGQSLKYRRDAGGQFVLYSVGWNETDDGGVVVLKKGSSPEVDIDQGDWVWRYPQT